VTSTKSSGVTRSNSVKATGFGFKPLKTLRARLAWATDSRLSPETGPANSSRYGASLGIDDPKTEVIGHGFDDRHQLLDRRMMAGRSPENMPGRPMKSRRQRRAPGWD